MNTEIIRFERKILQNLNILNKVYSNAKKKQIHTDLENIIYNFFSSRTKISKLISYLFKQIFVSDDIELMDMFNYDKNPLLSYILHRLMSEDSSINYMKSIAAIFVSKCEFINANLIDYTADIKVSLAELIIDQIRLHAKYSMPIHLKEILRTVYRQVYIYERKNGFNEKAEDEINALLVSYLVLIRIICMPYIIVELKRAHIFNTDVINWIFDLLQYPTILQSIDTTDICENFNIKWSNQIITMMKSIVSKKNMQEERAKYYIYRKDRLKTLNTLYRYIVDNKLRKKSLVRINTDNSADAYDTVHDLKYRHIIDEHDAPINLHLHVNGFTILILLRQFGCILCRRLATIFGKLKPVFDKYGIKQVAIGTGSTRFISSFREETGYEYPIFIDKKKDVYEYFMCKRGIGRSLFNIKTIKAFKSAVLDGYRQGMTSGDTLQLGGIFILYEGVLIYQHHEKFAGDMPFIKDIFSACKIPESELNNLLPGLYIN